MSLDLGWVQIQRKFLVWKEEIEGFSIITHEALTTLSHPQIAGEIEVCKTMEIGALKWCKEHIPRNGNDLTEGG